MPIYQKSRTDLHGKITVLKPQKIHRKLWWKCARDVFRTLSNIYQCSEYVSACGFFYFIYFDFCKVTNLKLVTGFQIFLGDFLKFFLRNLILPSICTQLLLSVFSTTIWRSFTWSKDASRSSISCNVLVMFFLCTSISSNILFEPLRFLRHCFWNFTNDHFS